MSNDLFQLLNHHTLPKVDLLGYLVENNSLNNTILLGRVVGIVEKASYLARKTFSEGVVPVLVEVLALVDKGNAFGHGGSSIVFSPGSVVVGSDDPSLIGSWVSISHKGGSAGATLRVGYRQYSADSTVNALAYTYDSATKTYPVVPSTLIPLSDTPATLVPQHPWVSAVVSHPSVVSVPAHQFACLPLVESRQYAGLPGRAVRFPYPPPASSVPTHQQGIYAPRTAHDYLNPAPTTTDSGLYPTQPHPAHPLGNATPPPTQGYQPSQPFTAPPPQGYQPAQPSPGFMPSSPAVFEGLAPAPSVSADVPSVVAPASASVSSELIHRESPLQESFMVEEFERVLSGLSSSARDFLVSAKAQAEESVSLPVRNLLLRVFSHYIFNSAFSGAQFIIPGLGISASQFTREVLEYVEAPKEVINQVKIRLNGSGSILTQDFQYQGIDNLDILFLALVDKIVGSSFLSYLEPASVAEDMVRDARRLIITDPYLASTVYNQPIDVADRLFFFLSFFDCMEESEEYPAWFNQERFTAHRDYAVILSILMDTNNPHSLIERSTLAKGISIPRTYRQAVKTTSLPFNKKDFTFFDFLSQEISSTVITYAPSFNQEFSSSASAPFGVSDYFLDSDETLYDRPVQFKGFRFNYSNLNWVSKYNPRFMPVNIHSSIQELEDSGLVVVYDNKIISATYFKMELYIYKKLMYLAHNIVHIPSSRFESIISSYEEANGFKLEELQKDALTITNRQTGFISGQAGSGKTTVSSVVIDILKDTGQVEDILMCAPTGKAARRAIEVNPDLDVRTVHSLFRLGIKPPSPFHYVETDIDKEKFSAQEEVAILVDESSMLTTTTFYNILRGISKTSFVYFLGDIKQLTPIGKGMPFASALELISGVELGVSKRSREGSGIALNCDIINQYSEPSNFRELVSTDDFTLVSCADGAIPKTIVDGVKNNLNFYEPDEIQVICPYTTNEKPHSASNLNVPLQEVFLPNAPVAFTVGMNEYARSFKLGARVINNRQMNTKVKYRVPSFFSDLSNLQAPPAFFELQQVPSLGVVNGELGHVVGVFPAQSVKLSLDNEFNSEVESHGKDISYDESEKFYVAVRFYDPLQRDHVIVLYSASASFGDYTEYQGYQLKGTQLGYLELAYALTGNKMQGSQSKLVVSPFASTDNVDFVNCNMVYTIASRAQERFVAVGSVQGSYSTLSRARRHKAITTTSSILTLLVKTSRDPVEMSDEELTRSAVLAEDQYPSTDSPLTPTTPAQDESTPEVIDPWASVPPLRSAVSPSTVFTSDSSSSDSSSIW